MSGHSKVKHGVAEEVLGMSNTSMICVQAGLGEAKWWGCCWCWIQLSAEEAKEIDIAFEGDDGQLDVEGQWEEGVNDNKTTNTVQDMMMSEVPADSINMHS